MTKIGIRLTGLGGQGIVLSSVILGRAASVYNHLNALQTQVYGSDMRGGDVCTEVILSDEKIVYPIVSHPDILIAVAQKSFNQHVANIKKNGILITDSDLVSSYNIPKSVVHFKEAFNRQATEGFGDNRVSNMIMLGFLAEKTKIISQDVLEKAIFDLMPQKILKINKRAVQKGVILAKNH